MTILKSLLFLLKNCQEAADLQNHMCKLFHKIPFFRQYNSNRFHAYNVFNNYLTAMKLQFLTTSSFSISLPVLSLYFLVSLLPPILCIQSFDSLNLWAWVWKFRKKLCSPYVHSRMLNNSFQAKLPLMLIKYYALMPSWLWKSHTMELH